MKKTMIAAVAIAAAWWTAVAVSAPVVHIEGEGADKLTVSVETQGSAAFAKCLKRNLSVSGAFKLAAPSAAAIRVTGTAAQGGTVAVRGPGKALSLASRGGDDAALRREARALADRMCETYAGRKGFASAPIAFVLKKGRVEELCTGYADGSDIRMLTQDGRASVGPRWKNSSSIYYTGFLNGNTPQVFEVDAASGRRRLAWGFGGLTTGATVAPGGAPVALVISKPFGNPELCTIDPAANTWKRLTTTPAANEGQPAWSPDGKSIAYVSDETRRQHLYVLDVAGGKKRRVTSAGTQNVDPDWGPSGKIAYITKRGGQSSVAVLDPAQGDKAGRLVTEPGAWEHPTWAPDGRHLAVERDGALFIVDTEENGDKPLRLFSLDGRCITPAWCRAGGAK